MRLVKKDLIGKILLATKIISKDQLRDALAKQEKSHLKLLGEILIEAGQVTQEQVLTAYALQHGIRYLNLDDVDIPRPSILDRLPVKYACKYTILPLKEDAQTFTIASHMPKYVNKTIVDDLQLLLDKQIELVICNKDQIVAKICEYYRIRPEDYERYRTSSLQDISSLPNLPDDAPEDPADDADGPPIIKTSEKMSSLYETIIRVSKSNAVILLLGETGTGKELIAKTIHRNSLRKDKPFIKVSCAALPETLLESEMFGYEKGAFTGAYGRKQGRFELADGGTLFLDEIGEISMPVQIKLLRVLQDGEFERLGGVHSIKSDVRIIAATNRNLEQETADGKFRKDLFYRLNVVSFTLPPLRDRKEDIPYLVEHFIQKFNKKNNRRIKFVSPKVTDLLMEYDWPGNIRELENCVERMVVTSTSEKILAEHIPFHLKSLEMQVAYSGIGGSPASDPVTPAPSQKPPDGSESLKHLNRKHIEDVLTQAKWNKIRAAKILGIHRNTLQRKIKEFGL